MGKWENGVEVWQKVDLTSPSSPFFFFAFFFMFILRWSKFGISGLLAVDVVPHCVLLLGAASAASRTAEGGRRSLGEGLRKLIFFFSSPPPPSPPPPPPPPPPASSFTLFLFFFGRVGVRGRAGGHGYRWPLGLIKFNQHAPI